MLPDELPDLPAGAGRIPFARASSLQLARALGYAIQRLGARFPALDWAAWSENFQLAQPQLVVQGAEGWLEWPGLARLVQRLAQSRAEDALDPPVFCAAAAELSTQYIAYDNLARKVRQELAAVPDLRSPLLDQLLEQLTSFNATAWRVHLATREAAPEASAKPGPPDSPVPVVRPLIVPVEQRAGTASATGSWPPTAAPAPPKPPVPERRGSLPRRTFRDIVQHHPRPNGKQGFTVRELCRAMRISASSLREAHGNPGRLTLNALSALAALMQEPLSAVVADLLRVPSPRKKGRRGGSPPPG